MDKGDIVKFVDFSGADSKKMTRYRSITQGPPYEGKLGIVLDTDIIGKTSLVWFYDLNNRKTWRLSNSYLKVISRIDNDN